jgi:hypothetical protein
MSTRTKIALAAALILGAAGGAQASTGFGTTGPTNPNMLSAASAIGRMAPSVNPSNPQDLTNRSHPQDMTLPRASNPQDLMR